MTTGPRPPAGDGMGLLHSTLRRRIRAFVPAIAVLALVLGPSWAAANGPAAPAQAMTVTVDLDRAAYLTGDLVQARVIVYRTPIPANSSYAFLVTAREGANRTQAEVTIDQAAGILLAVSFDRPAYAPGETIRAHLALTARGLSRLPQQFDWLLTFGPPLGTTFGARAITTEPEVDLSLPIPSGLGGGDVLVVAFESSTGASQYVTLHIGSTNPLWSTEVGGIPLFATLLALLFLLIFVAVIGLWRRIASVPPAAPLLGVTTSAPP